MGSDGSETRLLCVLSNRTPDRLVLHTGAGRNARLVEPRPRNASCVRLSDNVLERTDLPGLAALPVLEDPEEFVWHAQGVVLVTFAVNLQCSARQVHVAPREPIDL